MKLIAVRHGETAWNKAGKQMGQLNSDLTGLGSLQAQALADGLSTYPIDFFYASDLGRARQTADIISRVINKPYVTDARLRERNLGILQGLTMQEFKQRFPGEAAKWEQQDPDYVIPQGESIRQRHERSINFINELARLHPAACILVVCHSGVLKSYLHKTLELPLTQPRHYSLFNGSINMFNVSGAGEWQLNIWGELSHLRKFRLETIDDL